MLFSSPFSTFSTFTFKFSSHGVRFARSRLPVGEARGHAALEDRLHQGLGGELVHQVVGAGLVEDVIESEMLILQILGQVHLVLRLVHHQLVLGRHRHHVHLPPVRLPVVEGPLPHAHRDLVLHHGVGLPQGPELEAGPVLADHLGEFPVGVVLFQLDQLVLEGLLVGLALATLVAALGYHLYL